MAVPRTRAMTSPGVDELSATRPLAKYDWPRERTASLNTRETFWAIPIIPSQLGRADPTSGATRLFPHLLTAQPSRSPPRLAPRSGSREQSSTLAWKAQ